MTIAGSNFGASQGASTVQFNGTAAAPTTWSATSIVAPVPAGATTGPVVVTVNGTPSNGVTFTVTTPPPPSITSVSPTSGAVGTSVTIAGSNFGASQGASTVQFNGTAAAPTTWSATSIVAPVPAGATTGPVVVTVNGTPSNGVTFAVTTPPSITSVSPTSGAVGTSVTIAGSNFGASQGASTVQFNGTAVAPTTWSATSIVAPVPAGATTGPVVVTVNGTPSNGVTFTVTTPPSITSVSPTSGAVGTSVTIAGSNFGASQGASTVQFNGTAVAPTTWSATSIVAPVPAGATTGPVVVTVNGTSSNGVTFTVTPSGDTQAPTAPSNLTATVAGQGRIDLTWAASTDNVGVTGYRVEQCQGSGCTDFTEIAQVTAVPSGMGPLTASANPNYFKDAGGTPVILNGSHTWNNLQDWGTNGSLQTLDFNAFVSTLVANGHNFTFLWYIELPKFCGFPTTDRDASRFQRRSASVAENGPGERH